VLHASNDTLSHDTGRRVHEMVTTSY
jgi:hypothetical protein